MSDTDTFHYRLLGTDGTARRGKVVTPRGTAQHIDEIGISTICWHN